MTKKFIAVLEISEKDPYINDLDDLKEEIDNCLYLPGRVVSIKLMPEKLPEVSYNSGWWGWNKTLDRLIEEQLKFKDFAKGWNDCIDELLGGNE